MKARRQQSRHDQDEAVTPRQAVDAFIAILEAEQSALTSCDAPRLADFAQQKQALANRLAALSNTQPELASQPELQPRLLRAKILNEMNGKLISMQLQHFRHQLAALTRLTQPTHLYGADGLTERAAANRPLGVG